MNFYPRFVTAGNIPLPPSQVHHPATARRKGIGSVAVSVGIHGRCGILYVAGMLQEDLRGRTGRRSLANSLDPLHVQAIWSWAESSATSSVAAIAVTVQIFSRICHLGSVTFRRGAVVDAPSHYCSIRLSQWRMYSTVGSMSRTRITLHFLTGIINIWFEAEETFTFIYSTNQGISQTR